MKTIQKILKGLGGAMMFCAALTVNNMDADGWWLTAVSLLLFGGLFWFAGYAGEMVDKEERA